jgi:Rrf2 family iron-sulfur cluster assembly transcriptional regulator
MFLTTRGRYAVTAILDIAVSGNNAPVSLANISERQGISISYLEQIFLLLKKEGIVSSVKGPGGGYIIKQKLEELNLAQILSAAGEDIKMTRCSKVSTCHGKTQKCTTHHIWEACEDKILKYFSSITLHDLISESH